MLDCRDHNRIAGHLSLAARSSSRATWTLGKRTPVTCGRRPQPEPAGTTGRTPGHSAGLGNQRNALTPSLPLLRDTGPMVGDEIMARDGPAYRRSSAAFDRFSRVVEVPLIVLALAMIPVLLIPVLVHLTSGVQGAFDALDWTIWAIFSAEYAVKLWLAPERARYVHTHVPDLVVVVPVLRPLRVLRFARFARLTRFGRLGAFAAARLRDAGAALARRGLHYSLVVALVIVVAAAGAEAVFEAHAKDGNIHGFGNALWWAVVTVTTVGYGDRYPVTAAGRGVAVLLMLTGIAVVGVVTANIAAYLVETSKDGPEGELAQINNRLARIETLLVRDEDDRRGGDL